MGSTFTGYDENMEHELHAHGAWYMIRYISPRRFGGIDELYVERSRS